MHVTRFIIVDHGGLSPHVDVSMTHLAPMSELCVKGCDKSTGEGSTPGCLSCLSLHLTLESI